MAACNRAAIFISVKPALSGYDAPNPFLRHILWISGIHFTEKTDLRSKCPCTACLAQRALHSGVG